MLRVFQGTEIDIRKAALIIERLKALGLSSQDLLVEYCFCIDVSAPLSEQDLTKLKWIARFQEESLVGHLPTVLEVGSWLNFETSHSSTAIDIFRKCGVDKVRRIERFTRYGLSISLSEPQVEQFLNGTDGERRLYDRMTETRYTSPLETFVQQIQPEPVTVIPMFESGKAALEEFNSVRQLGMDSQDIDYYFELFSELNRNPTSVEIVGLGTCNSDHSRHRQFGGIYIIDGVGMPDSCMDVVKETWWRNPGNSVIAFSDNASGIRGGEVQMFQPEFPGHASRYIVKVRVIHNSGKVETHNHPTFIEPFEGAATGVAVLRDIFTVGRSGLMGVIGAGYSVGNPGLPGLEWEKDGWRHASNGASPLEILIRASDGASFVGNCIGQPLVFGFTRICGIELPEGYRSYLKPVMLAAAVGQIDDAHLKKHQPEAGMLVVQIGTAAHRVGIGGAAASSHHAGQRDAGLDFASVQRVDPEMGQRTSRVFRACVELGESNPVESTNDLGGGGEVVSLTELSHPAGAKLRLRSMPVADTTLSTEEIWINEDQERDAFLIRPENYDLFDAICKRENCPCAIVGEITGDGWLVLHDVVDDTTPVNLPLDKILGNLPRKVFNWDRTTPERRPLELPADLTVKGALERVLRLVSVGSKKFLTNKVDRSVTGLVAQQQCVGPNHLPLSDFAVMANGYFEETGVAISIGEQPLKGLVSHQAMARLSVAEAVLNMVGAGISDLRDVKFSGNWMWAPKIPGEGARLYETACALRDFLIELGPAIHGGKDSLSMAGRATGPDGKSYTSTAPGTLVLTATAPMVSILNKVTPDLKRTDEFLVFVDLSDGKASLGGSALAQVFSQVGNNCPDITVDSLGRGFRAGQELLNQKLISSVHDVSDGGLIVALLEMAFGGNVGLDVNFWGDHSAIQALFSEGPGFVVECFDVWPVMAVLGSFGLSGSVLGRVGECEGEVVIFYNDEEVLRESMTAMRFLWNLTSTELEKLQANPRLIGEEQVLDWVTKPPQYRLTFTPAATVPEILTRSAKPKVAILREEGSNADREMAAANYLAGLEPWEVTMTDLADGFSLEGFQGAIAVGGFAFRDEFGAGRGWGGVIRFNPRIRDEFVKFFSRNDTFSLGICNGCQMMSLMGWIQCGQGDEELTFAQNLSGRFESRFPTLRILPSPSILLKGMEGSSLGVWVAHGEGRLTTSIEALRQIEEKGLAPLRYVDCNGEVTDYYPYNPATSPNGIAGICSSDGRHLVMMPHPERVFLKWQWPWMPEGWAKLEASPWLKMFQNARQWCDQS